MIQNNTDDSVPQYHQQTSKLFHSKLSTPKDSTQEAHEGFCIERAKTIQSHGIKRENDLMVLLFFFSFKGRFDTACKNACSVSNFPSLN